jgi:hypothetical protein
VRNLLEPKKVPWTTRSKTIFVALCLYSALETMQFVGVLQNPGKQGLEVSPEAVAWRAGLLGLMALLAAFSAAAAAWSVHSARMDWHKAHGQVTAGIYAVYALAQPLLAWIFVPSQLRVGLVLSVFYLVFAALALNASHKATASGSGSGQS